MPQTVFQTTYFVVFFGQSQHFILIFFLRFLELLFVIGSYDINLILYPLKLLINFGLHSLLDLLTLLLLSVPLANSSLQTGNLLE